MLALVLSVVLHQASLLSALAAAVVSIVFAVRTHGRLRFLLIAVAALALGLIAWLLITGSQSRTVMCGGPDLVSSECVG